MMKTNHCWQNKMLFFLGGRGKRACGGLKRRDHLTSWLPLTPLLSEDWLSLTVQGKTALRFDKNKVLIRLRFVSLSQFLVLHSSVCSILPRKAFLTWNLSFCFSWHSFQLKKVKCIPFSPRHHLILHHEPENASYTPWETKQKKNLI